MISETVNTKVNDQSSKKMIEKSGKDTRKEVPISKKDINVGLRIPGSNWQRFKNLVTETTSIEQSSNDIQIKRKKHNRKPIQKHNDRAAQCIGISQVMKYLLYTLCSVINFIIMMFCGSKQQITKAEIKGNEKKGEPQNGLTRVIAMDCEMVGIGDGQDSMIARISIVNRYGMCIYDKYVKPTEKVRDYRTAVSGIRPHHLENGHDFKIVQKEVSEILKGRILVGHALHNDLSVLFLSHPKRFQRDTSRYKLFRKVTKGNTPSLKKLASELLGINIQSGEHNSIEDARAAMQLYQLFRKKWENDLRNKR